MEKEIFRDVIGYEGIYIVSNYGNVFNIKFSKIKPKKIYSGAHGYLYFRVSKNGTAKHHSVARAVAQAFPEICGEWFEGCTVDHIDTCKTNNVATNLRVVSLKENLNNPLTIAKKRLYRTDEERAEIRKQQKRKDYQKHKEYYNNYSKQYLKDNPDKAKEYARRAYLKRTPEQIEKQRQKSREYYNTHKKGAA